MARDKRRCEVEPSTRLSETMKSSWAHAPTASQIDHALLKSLFAISRDAVIVFDTSLAIVLFNPAAEDMFACSAAEVIGRDMFDLLGRPSGENCGPQICEANEVASTEGGRSMQAV